MTLPLDGRRPPRWFSLITPRGRAFLEACNRAGWGLVYVAPGFVDGDTGAEEPGRVGACALRLLTLAPGEPIPPTCPVAILDPVGAVIFEGPLPDVAARLQLEGVPAPFADASRVPRWYPGYSGCWG